MTNMRIFRLDRRNVYRQLQSVLSLASTSSRDPQCRSRYTYCYSMFMICCRTHVSCRPIAPIKHVLHESVLKPSKHNNCLKKFKFGCDGHFLHTTKSVTAGDSNTSTYNGAIGIDNDTSSKNSSGKANVDTLLETWFYEVNQYGSLTANIPFNTVVKPLNPQDYPDMNKVIIQLHYDKSMSDVDKNTNIPPSHQLSQISGLYDLNVTFDDDRANMNLTYDLVQGLDLPVSCTLHVPLKFGLMLKVSGKKSIYVEKMESDSVVIETESGNCNLHSIKCGSVNIVSKSGNIACNSTLLGNTILYTGSSGEISMEKIQGSCVTLKTEMGPMNVKSLYTEAATFKTVFGNIHLGHCHGQVHVLGENSQVDIDSLDGDLDVALQNGSVNVFLSRHNRVDIDISTGRGIVYYTTITTPSVLRLEYYLCVKETKEGDELLMPVYIEVAQHIVTEAVSRFEGDIGLSFPEGASSDLNLNCPILNVAENLGAQFEETEMPLHKEGFIGRPGTSQINARTQSGTIGLHLLDWIATTKLAFKKEE